MFRNGTRVACLHFREVVDDRHSSAPTVFATILLAVFVGRLTEWILQKCANRTLPSFTTVKM